MYLALTILLVGPIHYIFSYMYVCMYVCMHVYIYIYIYRDRHTLCVMYVYVGTHYVFSVDYFARNNNNNVSNNNNNNTNNDVSNNQLYINNTKIII